MTCMYRLSIAFHISWNAFFFFRLRHNKKIEARKRKKTTYVCTLYTQSNSYHLNFVIVSDFNVWLSLLVPLSYVDMFIDYTCVYYKFYHHHFSKCTKQPNRIPVYYPIDLLLKKSGFHFFSLVPHMTNRSRTLLLLLLLLTKTNSFSSIWSKNSKCQNRCWLMLTLRFVQNIM